MNINKLLLATILTVVSTQAEDNLEYIGKLGSNTKSFWLTHAGSKGYPSSFEVRDSGNNVQDSFGFANRGFRFSTSTEVDTTHTLWGDYGQGVYLADSANSNGGIIIPDAGGGDGGGGDAIIPALQVANIAAFINRSHSVSNRAVDSLLQRTYNKRESEDSTYNFWVDAKYYDFSDDRYGINQHGNLQDSYMGFDTLVGDDFTIGMVLGVEYSSQKSYSDSVQLDSDGYFFGPYAAYRFSENIVVDSWIGYATNNVETKISDNASGDFDLDKLFFTLNVTGNFALSDSFFILPKLGIYYSDEKAESFQLNLYDAGDIHQIPVSKYSYNYGVASLSADFEYVIRDKYSFELAPYANLGVDYAFERPHDGRVLVSLGGTQDTSPWNAKMKLGARVLVENKFLIDFNTAYSGLTESEVDIWSGHLSLSYVFN